MFVPLSIATFMTAVHLSFVLAGDGVTNPATQSIIMTASMIFNIVGAIFYSRLAARFSRRAMFIFILASFAGADLMIGFSPNAIGSTAGCWIAGVGGGLMSPFFTNVLLDRTAPAMHGRAIGLMYTAMYIGNFMNPLLITPLRASIGDHPAFTVVGLALALAVLAQAISRRSPVGVG